MMNDVPNGTHRTSLPLVTLHGLPFFGRFVGIQRFFHTYLDLQIRMVLSPQCRRHEPFKYVQCRMICAMLLSQKNLGRWHRNKVDGPPARGSNPTSAMSILGTSFNMELAGRNAGSMFGPGIYMAESSLG